MFNHSHFLMFSLAFCHSLLFSGSEHESTLMSWERGESASVDLLLKCHTIQPCADWADEVSAHVSFGASLSICLTCTCLLIRR